MTDIEASQTALKAATEGYARDTSKRLADSVASINEGINEVARRVGKLESK